jgi:hypothetical protein
MIDFILLDELLFKAQNGPADHPEVRTIDYNDTFEFLRHEKLAKPRSKTNYELLPEGKMAVIKGGYSTWKEENKSQSSFHISGSNNIIGSNNSNKNQGRDFLNSESPTIKNSPQSTQTSAKASNKSDHSVWDKIKYISVIIGGIAALIVTIGKLTNWW